ncbi:MAG TPA: CHAT domain-containing tetratricopeptide repeat protein, partial [Vicinamibacteria bacterium]|nr:CHAT domain-containing tetratricopeptide repeat protein [Vicinamibacteria bacterium]
SLSPDVEAWLLLEVARASVASPELGRRRLDLAEAALAEAIGLAQAANRPMVEAQLRAFLGQALLEIGRLDDAVAPLAAALALREASGPDSLAAAALADPIARLESGRGPEPAGRATVKRLAAVTERVAQESFAQVRAWLGLVYLTSASEQRALCARALGVADRLGPERLLTARVLVACGWNDPDPLRQQPVLERALSILERRAPDSALRAEALAMLGDTLDWAGEPARTPELQGRALELVERVAPGSPQHATVLNRIATYWGRHGDFVQAEALFRRALAIDESQPQASPGVVQKMHNIGEVLRRRRDFDQAEDMFTRALELSRRSDPEGALTGRLLHLLGRTLLERGEPARAEPFLREALPLLARAESVQVRNVRGTLGQCLAQTGRLEEAEALFRLNLEDAARGGESPFMMADRHQVLGALLRQRGELVEGERELRDALGMQRTLAPGSIGHAESSHELGLLAATAGRKDEARALFVEAVDALEAQGRRLGGSEETRAAFRAHYHRYYRDLEDILLELGRDSEAFEVLERSRSRGLLSLIASRDVGLGGQVPEDLARELRQADMEHDRAFRALQRPGVEAGARETMLRTLDGARRAQEAVRARIRASVPRVAAMLDPQPLDLPGVRGALLPGTLLLAFSLGGADARVYAVGPGPDDFAVLAIGGNADDVRSEVRRFRDVLQARRTGVERAAVVAASRRLGDRLLGPVAERLGRAERLLVVPDGPLHVVPFAALQDPSRPGRYLVESKTIEVAPSVTLYDTLARGSGQRSDQVRAVGFGDPAYPASEQDGRSGPALTRALAAGLRLHALPATRDEVAALRVLARDAQVWTGPAATEEKAKAIPRDTRFVHFACHGFLDERLPLESGLALAMPERAQGGDNGFLQAWEVFEGLRIDADQVTLSACQTGLGRDLAGEGLLGLTWAFLYAGARSVLASLWEVSDASTADLMKRLYRHLADGVPRAEALRRAQVELMRRRATSTPYYWAAFTLIGDGRPHGSATLAAP